MCSFAWLNLALLLSASGILSAQTITVPYLDKVGMHQHYDAAYRFQSSGDLPRADAEHKRFLAAALDRLGNFYANTGDYLHAAPVYDEALRLIPDDFALLMDYAGASLDARNPQKANILLQPVMKFDLRGITETQKRDIHLLLGRSLQGLGDTQSAIEQIRAAVAIDPSIDNYEALASALLELKGIDGASTIFAEMLARFGDSAAVRMRFGRIYALEGFPDRAIEEFKKAVARDYKMPDVHYSLGAAYMSNLAAQLPLAEQEFKKELELHPNDVYSYPQLGYIALRRLNYHEAQVYLLRAVAINPMNAQAFSDLGKLYVDTGRPRQAEAAFRKAIALTVDPSYNSYAIERSYYQLGQLLLARGDESEGQQELQIAQQLLSQRNIEDQAKMAGKRVQRSPLERTRIASLKQVQELELFAKQTTPLIAASYNNLGVHAAMREGYAEAAEYFELAAKWEPGLRGVDSNWGRAAFAAHDCAQAIKPLEKAIAADSSDPELAAMLNQCRTLVPSGGGIEQ